MSLRSGLPIILSSNHNSLHTLALFENLLIIHVKYAPWRVHFTSIIAHPCNSRSIQYLVHQQDCTVSMHRRVFVYIQRCALVTETIDRDFPWFARKLHCGDEKERRFNWCALHSRSRVCFWGACTSHRNYAVQLAFSEHEMHLHRI